MPAIINLRDPFLSGEYKTITFQNADYKGPSSRRYWIVLYGLVLHVTATQTTLVICQKRDHTMNIGLLWQAAAATGSFTGNLFDKITANNTALPETGLYVLSDEEEIHFMGDATATAKIQVIEFGVESKEKQR